MSFKEEEVRVITWQGSKPKNPLSRYKARA